MTLKRWLVGLAVAGLIGVAGCGSATTSHYRAGCCPPAPTTAFASAAPAPCCNGQAAIVAPVPPLR
jgi:hypothetical protein